jgi:hypothetical protein
MVSKVSIRVDMLRGMPEKAKTDGVSTVDLLSAALYIRGVKGR